MSTNCNIGILTENNIVEYIYCHFDGYVIIKRDNLIIKGAGYLLYKHYQNINKIKLLLKFGDIKNLECCPSLCDNFASVDYDDVMYHTLSLDEFETRNYPLYKYLFKDGEWFVKYHKDDWVKVKDYKYER